MPITELSADNTTVSLVTQILSLKKKLWMVLYERALTELIGHQPN